MLAGTVVLIASQLLARGAYLDSWETIYPDSTLGVSYQCNVCHAADKLFNPYGESISAVYTANGGDIDAAIRAVEPDDSDGDSFSNLAEISANTHPGDAADSPSSDVTSPTAPGNPSAVPVSSAQIDLSWGVSTDDVGVAHYNIYRDGVSAGQSTSTQWSDASLLPATTYAYYVTAEDAAGNESAPSSTALATTLDSAELDATVVSVDLPAHLTRGYAASATITMRNSGSMPWTAAAGFALGCVDEGGGTLWGVTHVFLAAGESVAPGEEKTFAFENTAPDAVGSFPCDCQMVQEGGAGWFGEIATGTISVTSFADVPIDHWASRDVEAIYAAAITLGYPVDPPLYAPADPVDRGQMAVYISRAIAGGDAAIPAGPSQATFPDVPIDHWAYRYVEYAVANSVVAGYDDGRYYPDGVLDRGQMAVFIARAVAGGDQYVPPPPPTATFPDVTPGSEWDWCRGHVEFMVSRGVVNGYDDGLYHPELVCSRDQMAVYIARAFSLLPK